MVHLLPYQSIAENKSETITLSTSQGHYRGSAGLSTFPHFFNLLMEPLANALNSRNILYHLYADDTQLYMKISAPVDLIPLNAILQNTQSWLTENHLLLNTKKNEFLLISPPNHTFKIDTWMKHLTSFDCAPLIIDSAKSLGVILDKHLSMQEQISKATKGANLQLSLLRKLKPFLPQDDLKMAVQALVLPRLDYGSSTLCGLPKCKLAPLRATLNAAARLVTGTKRNSRISPTLKTLNWLPYEARIHLKVACMTHKALHSNTPSYLAHKLERSGGCRQLRSADTFLLKPQAFLKKSTSCRAFSGIAPKIWNSLPPDTRGISSFTAFKKEVKLWLMNKFTS